MGWSMRRAAILALMLSMAAFAGCIGGDDANQDEAETASQDGFGDEMNETETNETVEDTGPTITTQWKNATWEGAQTGGIYYCNPPITAAQECDNQMALPVPANASAVVAELAWEQDTEVLLQVFNGTGDEVASTTDTSPLRIAVTEDLPEDEEAEWTLEAWVDSSTPTQVEATFAGSVVEDGEMPNSFSRFASSP